MEQDDPAKPEFATIHSYNRFARRVRHKQRFILSSDDKAFLATVVATNRDRTYTIVQGKNFYRAQLGIKYIEQKDEDGNYLGDNPTGYELSRMKPRSNRATEGRANPAGVPVLYLASTDKAAISEIRPWIGSEVSLAYFKVLRDLKVIDLSENHGRSFFRENGFKFITSDVLPTADEKETAVWIDIDNAFSQPVTLSDDQAEYVPTQILSELFRDAGYDGIVYKSQLDVKGYNIVLFDVDDADAIACIPYVVTAIDVQFKQATNG